MRGREVRRSRRKKWGPVDWMLLAAALVCLVLILERTVFRQRPGTRGGAPSPHIPVERVEPTAHYPAVDVSAEWLSEHLGDPDLRVLDARGESAYTAGHIPGALSVPARELEASTAGRSLAEFGLEDSARAVCYGEGSYSAEAARLLWLLDVAGADSARLLNGGISAWIEGGGALELAGTRTARGTWTAEPRADRLATYEYVMERFGRRGVELIDARGEEQWSGTPVHGDSAADSRPGHIPHSLPFDFSTFLEGGWKLLSPFETRRILAQLGPRPTSPVDLSSEFIVYGDGTGEGALGYFLLRRAGVERVRYYERGWAEWSGDPASPIVGVVGAEEIARRLREEGERCLKDDLPPRGFVLLDARGGYDYDLGHIPGAVSLPSHVFPDSLDGLLSEHWPGIDRAEVFVVVYCYDSGCVRSRNCATMAAQRGLIHVGRFRGGVSEWKQYGGELK